MADHTHAPIPSEVLAGRGQPPREPVTDPTLGLPIDHPEQGQEPRHRLVTIGDSLTHGFQSGAVFNTDLSYPAIIAHEMGSGTDFRFPVYPGYGGLPLNIELLLRELQERFGKDLDWWEVPLALFHARRFLDEVEDYWERGPGSVVPQINAVTPQPLRVRLGPARRPRKERQDLPGRHRDAHRQPAAADRGEQR
ncbi:hypothetical protein [Streptomyces sp. NPDC096324]|uniref:hypothetical protein n=1 Tax=Streptomyces sp. NPDC096324 TaxID=3366085 RepID=UPI00380AEAC9